MSDGPGPLFGQADRNRAGAVDVSLGERRKGVAKFDSGPCAARRIAIVLDARPKGDDDTTCPIAEDFVLPLVRAHITWGIGGTRQFHAVCDFLKGTQVSVVAESVAVQAEYLVLCCPTPDSPAPTESCHNLPPMSVAVGFGYEGGGGGNSNPARYTDLVCVPDPAGKKRVAIPDYAISWNAYLVEGSSTAKVSAFGFGRSLSVPYILAGPVTNVGQHDVENAFPIWGGERFLEFENLNQEGPLMAIVVFGLALG